MTERPSYYCEDAATLTTKLTEYEPLVYEVQMLHDVAVWTMQAPRPMTQLTENVLAESFAIHFRNLAAFLWPYPEQQDRWPRDVLAKNFVKDSAWSPPVRTEEIKALVDRASREVGHLTTKRLPGRLEEKRWPLALCIRLLLPALVNFADESDRARRPPHLLEEITKLRRLVGDIPGAVVILPETTNLGTNMPRTLGIIG